ncbi:uncharacterized protein PADG_02291 [Paracoccidioides brasiliensis Pb18]|uniref:SUZ domain-containing protein n=1 Tax=Paracoccidioides brasiliensis (strain Pb18) TaxID=502780 RepID=C1G2C5_PARBD|nr:uncharacterized protein PADG_02291 [Paracoccidioides brasiliensis Pb18]EEH46141.2 hypothetical protein PADG_02291 [Paracoccidioides brasiliensis Pb18]
MANFVTQRYVAQGSGLTLVLSFWLAIREISILASIASKTSRPDMERPSFAEVAAMPPPPTKQSPAPHVDNAPDNSIPMRAEEASNGPSEIAPNEPPQNIHQEDPENIDHLNKSVQNFHIHLEKNDGDAHSETGDGRDDVGIKPEGAFEDDQTYLSNSSTKPTSFDSKSMASVTTFAMDEKESLRPDDSASVQAAEEDDSFSGPASDAPNSQVGSEASGRLYRMSGQGVSERFPNRTQLNNTGITEIISPNGKTEQVLHSFPNEPDEKLLEAMISPKDRLLILQLEEKIIAFIKDSAEQSLELPPCNAFGRLLAHKLGDYYHLTHFVDNNVTSVRLHRTPWCRLPTPLSMLQPPNAIKTPPPNAPAMKIMRRSGQTGGGMSGAGSTAPSSSAPSKATSEAGADGNEEGAGSSLGATPAKDRATMSREEREAKYQEARERIFRDFPESKTSDNSNNGDQSANISRSNSGNGNRKGHKQRTPHDDSFEARSQFNAYYPGAPYSSAPPPFNGIMPDGSFGAQSHYYMSASSLPPSATFPQDNNHVTPAYQPPGGGNVVPAPQYPVNAPPHMNQNNWHPGHLQPSPPYAGFSQVNQMPPMVLQQASTRSSPGIGSYALPNTVPFQQQNTSTWNQPQYPTPYSPQSTQRNSSATLWPNYPQHSINSGQVTFPYNQMQNQRFPPGNQNNSSQHPFPGSFSRSNFNPQTRSFVPGGNSQSRFPGNPPPTMNPPYMNSPPQYSTPPSWTGNQDQPHHSSTNYPPTNQLNPQSNMKTSAPPPAMVHSPIHGPSSGPHDSIAKWGTPAHLPPKPPPSQVPYDFDLKNKNSTLPLQSSFTNPPPSLPKQSGPLVVSSGISHQRPRGNMTTGV